MKNRVKIIYVGLDIETLHVLLKEDSFLVAGVGLISNFSEKTFNPINLLFRLIYKIRHSNKFPMLEKALLSVWKLTHFFSTRVWRKYANYLVLISESKLQVIDLEDIDAEKILKDANYELMVVNAWGILPEAIINALSKGAINIHPSKLPQYRGALPTLWSLKNGDKESAVSYIILNGGIDSGKIINQHIFEISSTDDWFSLEMKIAGIITKTLAKDLKGYINKTLHPYEQNTEILSITGKYEEYREIKFTQESAREIYNKVNLYPYLDPETYCYLIYKKRKIFLTNAKYIYKKPRELSENSYLIQNRKVIFSKVDGIIECAIL